MDTPALRELEWTMAALKRGTISADEFMRAIAPLVHKPRPAPLKPGPLPPPPPSWGEVPPRRG